MREKDVRAVILLNICLLYTSFSVNLPCFLVKLVMRDSEKHEMLKSPEILEEALKEELTRCLPCCYWMINMEPFSYILVVPCGRCV